VATDDKGDAAAGERVQDGQGGQHVGGQAVVHERDAVDDVDNLEAVIQRDEALGRAAQGASAAAPGDTHGARAAAGDPGLAAPVPADQAERGHPGGVGIVRLVYPLN